LSLIKKGLNQMNEKVLHDILHSLKEEIKIRKRIDLIPYDVHFMYDYTRGLDAAIDVINELEAKYDV